MAGECYGKEIEPKSAALFPGRIGLYYPYVSQSSKYSLLQDGHLGGLNGEGQNEIRKKVWALFQDYFLKERNKRKEEFGFRLFRNPAIAADTSGLIKAAVTSGVDSLLVNTHHKSLWGANHSDDFSFGFEDGTDDQNQCMIDLAAVKVLNVRGRVFMLAPGEMPDKA